MQEKHGVHVLLNSFGVKVTKPASIQSLAQLFKMIATNVNTFLFLQP